MTGSTLLAFLAVLGCAVKKSIRNESSELTDGVRMCVHNVFQWPQKPAEPNADDVNGVRYYNHVKSVLFRTCRATHAAPRRP